MNSHIEKRINDAIHRCKNVHHILQNDTFCEQTLFEYSNNHRHILNQKFVVDYPIKNFYSMFEIKESPVEQELPSWARQKIVTINQTIKLYTSSIQERLMNNSSGIINNRTLLTTVQYPPAASADKYDASFPVSTLRYESKTSPAARYSKTYAGHCTGRVMLSQTAPDEWKPKHRSSVANATNSRITYHQSVQVDSITWTWLYETTKS